jgi:hypothetical protein
MGFVEDYKIGKITLKIFSRLPYKMECKLEELLIKMGQGMGNKLSDFEDIDLKDIDLSLIENFDMSKKIAINDFLLINAILEPEITEKDLDDYKHELNSKFKQIGDYLFDKYIAQYSEKSQVKKKLTKSPN